MKLSVRLNGNTSEFGAIVDGVFVAVRHLAMPSEIDELETWSSLVTWLFDNLERIESKATQLMESRGVPWDLSELESPILAPGKILCVGLNYADHVKEVGLYTPDRPHVFSKLRTALNGPTGDIHVPWHVASSIDYEVELGLVIGRTCKDVAAETALDQVLGYVVANDVSARDWQFAADGQLTLGKGFDGFLPVGSWIVTADELRDPGDLRLRCWVDEELRQDSSTAQLVASVPEVVAFLSSVCTLEAGDLVLTGTPPGVGMGFDPPRYLKSGQTVTTEVESIGILKNRIL